MILSTSKLNKLLETFKMSRNILPYNMSIEKQEMQNAKNFINNYHMYGTPFNHTNSSKIIYLKRNKTKISSFDEQSKNSYNSDKSPKNIKTQKYTNLEDIEIAKSLTNLRQSQKIYQQQQLLPKMKSASNIFRQNYLYNNPYLPFQSTKTIYLNNQSLYNPHKSIFSRNNINTSLNRSYSYKIKSLKDIPSNPEDVVIKNLPANFSQVINPVSSNIITSNYIPINANGENFSITENKNIAQKVEEINTDVIPTKQFGRSNQQMEEEKEILQEIEETKEEPTPAKKGKYQITACNGQIK
jgi:hypothetical protein